MIENCDPSILKAVLNLKGILDSNIETELNDLVNRAVGSNDAEKEEARLQYCLNNNPELLADLDAHKAIETIKGMLAI